MCATRFDLYEIRPSGLDAYLSLYGWHFSKKMYEWAVSKMKDRDGRPLKPMTKEDADAYLRRAGVKLDNDLGYDSVYVMSMAQADLWQSSITSESSLAKYVKDYLDDKDGYEGIALTRFYADCVAKGMPVIWEDMI